METHITSAAPCKDHGTRGNRKGYALVRHKGKVELVHRIVYCDKHGIDIRSIRGLVVRHTCDNSRCIEPSHLLIGTQADNVRDTLERGRNYPPPHRSGGQHPMARLTFNDVKSIRAEYQSGARQSELARKFGVSPQNINLIVKYKIWDERVCDINERIAPLTINANGLATLGFQPAGTERSATLYREADFPLICDAIVRQIQKAREQKAAA